MTTVYLASPLGFSPEWKSHREMIKRRLDELGCTILDPWENPFHTAIAEASTIQDWPSRVKAFKAIPTQIGKANEEMIRASDVVFGVIDRAELDSGTAMKLDLPLRGERGATAWGPISSSAVISTEFPSNCGSCIGLSRAEASR